MFNFDPFRSSHYIMVLVITTVVVIVTVLVWQLRATADQSPIELYWPFTVLCIILYWLPVFPLNGYCWHVSPLVRCLLPPPATQHWPVSGALWESPSPIGCDPSSHSAPHRPPYTAHRPPPSPSRGWEKTDDWCIKVSQGTLIGRLYSKVIRIRENVSVWFTVIGGVLFYFE